LSPVAPTSSTCLLFSFGVASHLMKTRYILFGLFVISSAVFARVVKIGDVVIWPSYDYSKIPSISLPVAYQQALTFLGQDTNQYHCVSANLGNWNFKDGEWDFYFRTQTQTNGTSLITRDRDIAVFFDGTVTNVSPIL